MTGAFARTRGVRYIPYRQAASRPNIVVDGAPLPSTVLTLSHWPVNATPEPFKRDTSTETALAWIARHDPRDVAAFVTNNHFDEDGLFSMFAVTQPELALRHSDLLADAARAGDFGMPRSREGARLCFIIEAHADPTLSPFGPSVFALRSEARVAALYRRMLPLVAGMLDDQEPWRRYWQVQDRYLQESRSLVASGQVVIEEEPELDLAIVRLPQHSLPQTVWRYLRPEAAVVHPFAVHGATRCTRLVRIQGRRIEFQYRYESWLQIQSCRPAMRVDLAPFARWLNRHERNGCWQLEDLLDITPRLYLEGDGASSLSPETFLRELRRHLERGTPIWDPYHWTPGKAKA